MRFNNWGQGIIYWGKGFDGEDWECRQGWWFKLMMRVDNEENTYNWGFGIIIKDVIYYLNLNCCFEDNFPHLLDFFANFPPGIACVPEHFSVHWRIRSDSSSLWCSFNHTRALFSSSEYHDSFCKSSEWFGSTVPLERVNLSISSSVGDSLDDLAAWVLKSRWTKLKGPTRYR